MPQSSITCGKSSFRNLSPPTASECATPAINQAGGLDSHKLYSPLFENIPAELTSRPQWVVWRYEQRGDKRTKVPYVPGTLSKARTNRPSTWRSFAAAVAAYEQNPVGLDGIGYVFAKDDPFVGGDQDHDLSTDRIPLTYAEISPSGTGIKFIARASGTYGRKTARGELYSHGRFFTITGHILDQQHAHITDQQEAIERFHAELGSVRTRRSGGTANGCRAELASAIERAVWDEANDLRRTQRDSLLRRERAAGKEGTQFAVLLSGDYAGFHQRWPFVGLYRADGTLDQSQRRAVHAYGLRGRGFTFPEYAALMSIHYGQEAMAKWGSIDLWKQELAALWDAAPAPRYTRRTPEPTYTVPATPRGRAGNHAALVERVYTLLLDHRIGVDALVKTGELAASLHLDRRTVAAILDELRQGGRIQTRRAGQYGGLVVSFSAVIYAPVPAGTACISDVIYSDPPIADPPIPAPQTDVSTAPPIEENMSSCVSSEHAGDHSLPALVELAAHYLDQRPAAVGKPYVLKGSGPLVDESTGEIKVSRPRQVRYRRTARHFAELVSAEYPYTTDQAIEAYHAEQQRRKEQAAEEWKRFFARLDVMTDDELIAYVAGRCRAEVAELARDGAIFDTHLYAARLKCAKRAMARRKLKLPAQPTRIAEQARADAKRATAALASLAPKKQRPIACEQIRYERPAEPGTPASLIAALKARLEAQRG